MKGEAVIRHCSRNGCRNAAVATLTYVYSDQSAILGPLATVAEPHCYDLCAAHSERLTAPRGWDVVRLAPTYEHSPSEDDLLALANAVREAATKPLDGRMRTQQAAPVTHAPAPAAASGQEPRPRGHLRILRDGDLDES